MSLLRYSAQEARNIAAAEARAKQQSALNASLAEKRALQTVDADYQPASDRLTQIAELALTDGDFLQFVGASWAALSASEVKEALDLDAVDNTSDADKPISDAVQDALNAIEAAITDLQARVAALEAGGA